MILVERLSVNFMLDQQSCSRPISGAVECCASFFRSHSALDLPLDKATIPHAWPIEAWIFTIMALVEDRVASSQRKPIQLALTLGTHKL
jgi:hypothetical protein